MTHALGIPGGVLDRGRPAARQGQQRKALKCSSVHHGSEIADIGVKRWHAGKLSVRESAAALVVADKRVAPAELPDPMPPDRALQLVVEVGHPVARLDQRRTLAVDRVCEPDAVVRGAEASLVPQGDDRNPGGYGRPHTSRTCRTTSACGGFSGRPGRSVRMPAADHRSGLSGRQIPELVQRSDLVHGERRADSRGGRESLRGRHRRISGRGTAEAEHEQQPEHEQAEQGEQDESESGEAHVLRSAPEDAGTKRVPN